jgi:hypothetical protein
MNKLAQFVPGLIKTGFSSCLALAVLLVVTAPTWAGYTPPPDQTPPNDSSGSSTSFKYSNPK